MKQPSTIFYTIVCVDTNMKKSIRHSSVDRVIISHNHKKFLGYYEAGGNYIFEHTKDTPVLWKSKEDVEKMFELAQAKAPANISFEIEVMRVFESSWSPHSNDELYSRIKDAREIGYQMLHYDVVSEQIKKLAGKVLTIIDAAYVNENQNKAVKDLVKTSFKSQLSTLWEKAVEDPRDESEDGDESKDDILN